MTVTARISLARLVVAAPIILVDLVLATFAHFAVAATSSAVMGTEEYLCSNQSLGIDLCTFFGGSSTLTSRLRPAWSCDAAMGPTLEPSWTSARADASADKISGLN